MPFKINLLENIGGVIMNEKPAGKVVEVDIDRIYPKHIQRVPAPAAPPLPAEHFSYNALYVPDLAGSIRP